MNSLTNLHKLNNMLHLLRLRNRSLNYLKTPPLSYAVTSPPLKIGSAYFWILCESNNKYVLSCNFFFLTQSHLCEIYSYRILFLFIYSHYCIIFHGISIPIFIYFTLNEYLVCFLLRLMFYKHSHTYLLRNIWVTFYRRYTHTQRREIAELEVCVYFALVNIDKFSKAVIPMLVIAMFAFSPAKYGFPTSVHSVLCLLNFSHWGQGITLWS